MDGDTLSKFFRRNRDDVTLLVVEVVYTWQSCLSSVRFVGPTCLLKDNSCLDGCYE